MNRFELVRLKRLVSDEVNRRKRVKELLRNELVKEYLELTNTKACELDSENINEVIDKVLETFTITKTNGIYVCTSAYFIDCAICYQDTDYYSVDVDIDSKYAECKVYVDIENKNKVHAARKLKEISIASVTIDDFEKTHLVLNPYNTCENHNGYDEVRHEFFRNAIEYGQPNSKQLILSKYPKL
jgi:hypothetical protein